MRWEGLGLNKIVIKMRIKKNLLFLILSCILFITSSNTNDKINNNRQPIEESYLKAKINGEEVFIDAQEYFNTFYGELPDGRWYLGISGGMPEEENLGLINSITVQIWQLNPVKEGNYQNGRWEEMGMFGNLYVGVLLGYADKDFGMMQFVTDIEKPQATLQITELTNEYIRATFGGTIYDPLKGTSLEITDGELFVKRTD